MENILENEKIKVEKNENENFIFLYLLLEISYTFKNIGKQFFLKTKMTCYSRNLIYVVICPTCKEEYIGETGIGDSNFRDRVRIYRQHIRQPEHEKLG